MFLRMEGHSITARLPTHPSIHTPSTAHAHAHARAQHTHAHNARMSNTSSSKAKLNRSPQVTRCSARYVLQSRHPKFARCSLIRTFHDGITRQHMRTHANTQTQSRTHADTNVTQTQTQTQTPPPPPPQLWQKPQPQSAPQLVPQPGRTKGKEINVQFMLLCARGAVRRAIWPQARRAQNRVGLFDLKVVRCELRFTPQDEYCASS